MTALMQGYLLNPTRLPEMTAGVDEAGRGCLAGPVVAAAVVLPPRVQLKGLTDSKLMAVEDRERLEPQVKKKALCWALGVSWPREIDRINILQASFTAMSKAVRLLRSRPELLLVDGHLVIPDHYRIEITQRAVVGGDLKVRSISAASVLAKTFRDRLMAKLDRRYPGYGFAAHKGYATPEHYRCLKDLGPCPLHRMTFRGVAPETSLRESELWLPGT